jgi:hypothetical protein
VPSRRDDLEALTYVLLKFLLGSLPWTGLYEPEEFERMKRLKISVIEDLGDSIPPEMATFLASIRSLAFNEKPKYSYLRRLLSRCFHRNGFKYDLVFDWTDKVYNMALASAQDASRASKN